MEDLWEKQHLLYYFHLMVILYSLYGVYESEEDRFEKAMEAGRLVCQRIAGKFFVF